MNDVESWTTFMVGAVVAYRRPACDHVALAAHMTALLPAAAPRFHVLGATKSMVLAMLRNIHDGHACGKRDGMPGFRYATQMRALRDQMKPNLASLYVDPSVPESLAKMMRLCMAMLVPDTGTVAKKDAAMNKAMVVIPDRVIRRMFSPPAEALHDQQGCIAEASRIVERFTGRKNDPRMTPAEKAAAKIKDPAQYKRYLRLRQDIATAYQDHVRNAAREAGKPVRLGPTIRDMKKAGISYHPYAGLERLHVGEDGNLYTPAPHRLIKAMPAPGSRVVFNEQYDPKTNKTYVFKYQVPGSKRDANSFSAAYTTDYLKVRKDAKFDLVLKASAAMPTLRPKWLRDLKSRDPYVRTLAAMTEIIYSQAMRIGGNKNAVDGKPTYGLATLRVNHVTLRNGSAILQYAGKDLIQQKHVLRGNDRELPENAQVIQIIQRMAQGKKGTDRLWTDPNGRPIEAGDVRAYMKGKGIPFSPHKFRHVAGTVMMTKLLDRLRIPKGSSQLQVEKLVKNAAVQVGGLLGHMSGDKISPATSIKNYIHPGLIANFFRERGLRIPGWVPAAGRGDDE